MPFFNIWGRVLHILFHMLLTRVTRVPMNQRQVMPVVLCGQSADSRWKSCRGLTKCVSSSSLWLPMQLANRAISIVGSVIRMSRCWRMALMRSCDTIRGLGILPVTSNWDWRLLVGGSWILKETPLAKVSWSGERSTSFDVLWLFGIESTPLPRI